jgi:geranylgeranyl pyrophosphate synthase
VIDDVLDLVGSPEDIGKTALADVREGKLTYPIVIAIGRNPMLGQWLAEAVAASHLDSAKIERLAHAIRETGAAEEARLFAESITKDALARLATIPPSSARDALAQAAERCLRRPS